MRSYIEKIEAHTTENLFMLGSSVFSTASPAFPTRNSSEREPVEALRECEERYQMLLDGIEGYAIFMMDVHLSLIHI